MNDEIIDVPPDDEGPPEPLEQHVVLEPAESLNWAAVFIAMKKKDREKVARKMMSAYPDVRKADRDRMRRRLAYLFVWAVFVDAAAAIALRASDAIGGGTVQEWLTLALVPLTPGVTAALYFWYPSKDAD